MVLDEIIKLAIQTCRIYEEIRIKRNVMFDKKYTTFIYMDEMKAMDSDGNIFNVEYSKGFWRVK